MIILVNYRNIGLHFSIFDQCVERIVFSALVVPRMPTKRIATRHYRVSVLDSTYHEINITVNRKRFRFIWCIENAVYIAFLRRCF